VEIALIGKYTDLKDSYISHEETLRYTGALEDCRVRIRWLEAPDLEEAGNAAALEGVNGVVVPGGFGNRGAEGKIMAAQWARENRVPYLGVCFGFQLAVIEFCRNVLDLKGANSSELDPDSPHHVVDLLPEQREVTEMGATMRLGDHDVALDEGVASKLYGSDSIQERHRHRFEINPDYIERIEAAGMRFTGRDTSGRRMEVLELEGHPYFLASQFHPEFKSRPDAPSPLHLGLVRAALEHAA
jgi:CTP synthase